MPKDESCSHLYDCRILFTPLLELIKCKPRILVQIHVPEDLVDPLKTYGALHQHNNHLWEGTWQRFGTHLFRRILVLWQPHHLARHLVYRSHDLQHLIVGDEAVVIDVIQLERPYCSSAGI